MLILTRRANEAILIGDDVEVLIMDIKGSQVRIGVSAPRTTVVDRKEVAERKAKEAEIRELMNNVNRAALDYTGLRDFHGKNITDVQTPADEIHTLRAGIDYDPDAVCPGCGCFRDKCACDLREATVSVKAGKS